MFPATTTRSTRSGWSGSYSTTFSPSQQGRQDHLYRPSHAVVVRYDGRDINTDRHLILHEAVEKTLIDQLNLHYLHAHQILKPQGVKAN
jgi:hypothetical protein